MTNDEKRALIEARIRELKAIVDRAGDVLLDEIAKIEAAIERERHG